MLEPLSRPHFFLPQNLLEFHTISHIVKNSFLKSTYIKLKNSIEKRHPKRTVSIVKIAKFLYILSPQEESLHILFTKGHYLARQNVR